MRLVQSFSEINWLALVVCLLLSFVIGALWHSLLFNKAWSEDSGTIYNKENHGNPLFIFGVSSVLHFVLLVGLAMFIGQHANIWGGALKALFVSVVWVATSIGVNYIFVGRTLRLFLIDAGYYIVFMTVSGLILGAWK